MEFEKLIKDKEVLDELHKKLVKLNNLHNEYLSKINSTDSTNIDIYFKKFTKEDKRLAKKIIKLYLITISSFLLYNVFFGIAVILIMANIIIPPVLVIASLTILWISFLPKIKKEINASIDELKNNTIQEYEGMHDDIYEELCNIREKYHKLKKEYERNLSLFSTEEYKTYQKLLDKYMEKVLVNEKYVKTDNLVIIKKLKNNG